MDHPIGELLTLVARMQEGMLVYEAEKDRAYANFKLQMQLIQSGLNDLKLKFDFDNLKNYSFGCEMPPTALRYAVNALTSTSTPAVIGGLGAPAPSSTAATPAKGDVGKAPPMEKCNGEVVEEDDFEHESEDEYEIDGYKIENDEDREDAEDHDDYLSVRDPHSLDDYDDWEEVEKARVRARIQKEVEMRLAASVANTTERTIASPFLVAAKDSLLPSMHRPLPFGAAEALKNRVVNGTDGLGRPTINNGKSVAQRSELADALLETLRLVGEAVGVSKLDHSDHSLREILLDLGEDELVELIPDEGECVSRLLFAHLAHVIATVSEAAENDLQQTHEQTCEVDLLDSERKAKVGSDVGTPASADSACYKNDDEDGISDFFRYDESECDDEEETLDFFVYPESDDEV